eukprot:7389457-Prymnesium_polylepis.1
MILCSPSPGSDAGDTSTRSCLPPPCPSTLARSQDCAHASMRLHMRAMNAVPGVSIFESNRQSDGGGSRRCAAAGGAGWLQAAQLNVSASLRRVQLVQLHSACCELPMLPQPQSGARSKPHMAHREASAGLCSVHVWQAQGAAVAGGARSAAVSELEGGSTASSSSRARRICSRAARTSLASMAEAKRRSRCCFIFAIGHTPSTAMKMSERGRASAITASR